MNGSSRYGLSADLYIMEHEEIIRWLLDLADLALLYDQGTGIELLEDDDSPDP